MTIINSGGTVLISIGSDVMATESQFRVPEAFSKPSDEEALNFEVVLLRRNWSENHGNFGGSIEYSFQISMGIKWGLRTNFSLEYVFRRHCLRILSHEALKSSHR